jgi:tRNA (guanine37-N1)-methyltransferase
MRIDVLTLFPEMLAPLFRSVIGRAAQSGALELNAVNIRDFSADRHGRADDRVFGGGEGMLMTPQPVADCIRAVDPDHAARRIYMSPKGRLLTVQRARELAEYGRLLVLCGRYEGVDQRVIDAFIDEEISIGDFVLTGGELPAMILIDCTARFVPGVLGKPASAEEESFNGGLLEYPHYTHPREFEGRAVPDVLLNGNHGDIARWRTERREELTRKNRPDLYRKYLAARRRGESGGKSGGKN